MSTTPWHTTFAATAAAVARQPRDARFVYPLRHGTMRAGLYAPPGVDDQQPHAQDELYLVASGSGHFVKAGQRVAVAAGDLLFVAAGEEHRFEDFTEDFATWVVFWGPQGGEAARDPASPH